MNTSSKSYDLYSERLESFKNWQSNVSPESLAMAGFYLSETGDKTICFSCKEEFENWTVDENPWLVHYTQNNKCPFIIENKSVILEVKNQIIINNHLKGSVVKELVETGEFTLDEIKNTLEYSAEVFNIVPQTIAGIEHMVLLYRCKDITSKE